MAGVPKGSTLPGGRAAVNPSLGSIFGHTKSPESIAISVVQEDLKRVTQRLEDLKIRFTQLEEIVDRGPWPFLRHKEVSDEPAETRQTS